MYMQTRRDNTDVEDPFIRYSVASIPTFWVYHGFMCTAMSHNKLARYNSSQNQNQNSLLVTHQLTYIHQGQRMRGLFSRSHQ